jgi:hypothetical protein
VPKPPPALEEHLQSSEDASHPHQGSEADGEGRVLANGSAHQSPPRRGIWEWARVGTGRLNIIGRLPHPEWKSPASKQEELVVNGAQEDGRTTESRDDFDIPSATATEPNNVERQETTAAAKIEGLGILSLSTMMSPNSFSQTKRSSDDLIANASETTGSPSPRIMKHGEWTNRDDTTPTASKPTSPTTPDTPTPSQRRTDSIMEVPKPKETKNSYKPKETQKPAKPPTDTENVTAVAPGSAPAKTQSSNPKTPSIGPKTPKETTAENDGSPAAGPGSAPAKSYANGTSSPRHIPTYKIALTSSLLSPARRSASAAH